MSRTFKNEYTFTIDEVARYANENGMSIGIEREGKYILMLGYTDTDEHVFTFNSKTRQLFTDMEIEDE